MQLYSKRSSLPFSATQVFAWHEKVGAFERLNPPWQPVEVLSHIGGIKDGAQVTLKVPLGPLGITWKLRHQGYKSGNEFSDTQISGPFSFWEHRHLFSEDSPTSSTLEDSIRYKLPGAFLGKAVDSIYFKDQLDRLFRYRHTITRNDLSLINSYQINPLVIAISGASGLVGESLSAFLSTAGHSVKKLVRSKEMLKEDEIYWNPYNGEIELKKLEGVDVVINLSGESIASKRWSTEQKRKILNSRIETTKLLVDSIGQLSNRPKLFLSASAIGFYGDRGDEECSELSSAGEGFLSEVVQSWEQEAQRASTFGVRAVQARLGLVISAKGGALAKMLPPFLLGVGGPLGNGSQIMSWISLDDLIGAIYHIISKDNIHGAINLVTPRAVSNLEFTRTLGDVINRPTLISAPKFGLKFALGEMAEALLLSSTRVIPKVLSDTNYNFLFGSLDAALRHQLGR